MKSKKDKPQDMIYDTFGISKSHMLLDDVSCVLRNRVTQSAGRMYIFDKYVCFYSKMLGSENKLVIPLKKVSRMKKAKALGLIDNAIKFYVEEDNKKHFFKRVKNRDQIYEMIHSLWI